MLEDVQDREQFIGGLVFIGAFVAAWFLGLLVFDYAFAIVLAGIVATMATIVHYGYVQYVRHRQEIAESIDEHRYRFDRFTEALQRFAESTGADDAVRRLDARLEATVTLLRERLEDAETAAIPETVLGALRFLVTGERPPPVDAGSGASGSERRPDGDSGSTAEPSRDGTDGDA